MAKEQQSRQTKRQQLAKTWLTKGGIFHEDSDDELGCEDLPWEWIYDGRSDGTFPAQGKIVGARMGSFECRLGQPVLLKSPEPGKDWAGIISEFLEADADTDGEDAHQAQPVKSANIMWFTSPDEFLSTKNKRRTDALPNEQYITVDFNLNPLTSINGKAIILSKDAFYAKYPNGKPPRGKAAMAEYNKCIVCRRGVNQLQGKYTEEFVWEDVYDGSEDGVFDLLERIRAGLRASRKRRAAGAEGSDDDSQTPKTPSKRQKTGTVWGTPRSQRRPKTFTTPTQKRISVKKPLEFTPLGTRKLSPSFYASSPYSQARGLLHVSKVPTSLPCRDAEFHAVYESLQAAISEGTGACIYISGPPGTGKTATVREVIAHLNADVLSEKIDDFIFVEINGMKVTDPHQSYSLLWEALKGDRVSPSHALSLLEREFSRPSPRRVPCVVLMDELDQLVTKNQSVMYNFFNWPALRHSRLVVLAVANTMDLPERTLSNKISSRIGLTRITFSGYKHQELMKIIESRLENVPGNVVDSDAIQFASRKVAAVSGDARRALDICRRAVEIAESASSAVVKAKGDVAVWEGEGTHGIDPMTSTPTKSRTRGRKVSQHGQTESTGTDRALVIHRVTISTIKQAIQEATSTPFQQTLRCLSFPGKVFLSGLLARIRRTGLAESSLGDILDEAKRITMSAGAVTSAAISGPKAFLLNSHKNRMAGMGVALIELANAGILAVEGDLSGRDGRKGFVHAPGTGNRSGMVKLRIATEDVRASFRDDAEAKILGLGVDS